MAGAGRTPRAHEGGTTRARESDGHAEETRNRSVGKRPRSFSRHRGVSGAWARRARPRPPLFMLRRPGCASQLTSGVDYCNSRAPLGAASRLRGARLTSPVVSPYNTSWIRVGPRRRATSDRVTVVPVYSSGRGAVKFMVVTRSREFQFLSLGSARASTALTSHCHLLSLGSARA